MILRARTRFNVTNWAVVTCDRLSTWFSSFPRRQLPRKSLISHCTVHYNSFQIPVSLSSVTKKVIARNNRDEPVCGPKQVRIRWSRRNHDEEMKKCRWTKCLLDERRLTIDAVPRTCSIHWLNLQLFHTCLVPPLWNVKMRTHASILP